MLFSSGFFCCEVALTRAKGDGFRTRLGDLVIWMFPPIPKGLHVSKQTRRFMHVRPCRGRMFIYDPYRVARVSLSLSINV
jgi:hypothetical protein